MKVETNLRPVFQEYLMKIATQTIRVVRTKRSAALAVKARWNMAF
jgi:hypothetical protein